MKIADSIDRAIDVLAVKKPKNTTRLLFELACQTDSAAQLTKTELAGLKSAQAKWKAAFEATTTFSEPAAKMRWSQHLADGSLDHLSATTRTRSLESLVTEYASKMLVAKSNMGTASCDGAKIINVVFPRIASVAERLLTTRQEAERGECEGFGLAPELSPVTRALAVFVNLLKSPSVGGSGNPPVQMAPFILND